MFKICNYVGPKKVLEKGIKQEIMVLEPTRLSNGLDMEGDVGIKALDLGDLCNILTQGRKSARSRTEEGSSEFIFFYLMLFLSNIFIQTHFQGGVGNASYTRKSILCPTEEIVQTECILS